MVDITIFEVHLGDIDVPAPFEGPDETTGSEETEIAIEESETEESGGFVALLVTFGFVLAMAAAARRLRNRRRARKAEETEASQTTLSSD